MNSRYSINLRVSSFVFVSFFLTLVVRYVSLRSLAFHASLSLFVAVCLYKGVKSRKKWGINEEGERTLKEVGRREGRDGSGRDGRGRGWKRKRW